MSGTFSSARARLLYYHDSRGKSKEDYPEAPFFTRWLVRGEEKISNFFFSPHQPACEKGSFLLIKIWG